MLIFRYLAKEVFVTLVALTTILLLVFLSNQFVLYLNRAASGEIPGVLIMKLMMLELPLLAGLLLPLGFYVALLVAYGRLYADSEMTVLQACGYGPRQLLQHSFIMASFVAIAVLVIMVWVNPLIAVERAKLLRKQGVQTLIQLIVPGRFRDVSNGRQVYYVGAMSRDHKTAEGIFFAQQATKDGRDQWDVLWAETAHAETDPKTNEDYIILQQGKEYQGVPGHADYQIAEFERYKARLPHPTLEIKSDIRTASTASLWPLNNPKLANAAELQWRLSVPIMVLVLTLVGVPLSRVNPRAGKYAKLLPAIVVYIIYANFIFVARNWFVQGKTPAWLGMWWIHLLIAIVGLVLIYRNQAKLS